MQERRNVSNKLGPQVAAAITCAYILCANKYTLKGGLIKCNVGLVSFFFRQLELNNCFSFSPGYYFVNSLNYRETTDVALFLFDV